MRKVIEDVENLAFVTDRGHSIINGIAEVFPEAHPGYCMYHIRGNLKTMYRGKSIVALFRRAAEAYSFEEFEKFMVEIDSKSHVAWEYLTKMGIEHWSCASVLTPTQEDKLFKTLDVARKVYVEPLDQFRFFVRSARNFGYIVDLSDNACTCRLFQLESFPCTYAVTVTMHRGFPPHTLCSVYYMTDYWRAAYTKTIFPVSNEVEWEVPDHILPLNNLLSTAVGPRSPGSTRTSRILFTREFPQPRKCGKCGATGYTRRYCTSQFPLHDNVTDM
ncbi:uncharacterized protein LOC111385421 [Olea europaea var. sylvestris]|uniref:uncharacterized protein LOC111385421 n=1 Tax=Olea europaea var. sylvestris TaxID=158386 RepID=UPI000C1CDC1E|nr:uncharacterized protein LOC111385421 [Olea europaea var. sylvestris]